MSHDTASERADSVYGRYERARASLSGTQVAVGVALVAALAFTLLFLQEPALHDSMHTFRHGTGITCN